MSEGEIGNSTAIPSSSSLLVTIWVVSETKTVVSRWVSTCTILDAYYYTGRHKQSNTTQYSNNKSKDEFVLVQFLLEEHRY